MKLRSRILEFFTKELLSKIYDITNDVLIPDTNTKVDKIIKLLNDYDLDFDELGPGTNRVSIFMDSYVFKIALDSYGIHDNWREFIMSSELQPFVSKTYECNGLIAVAEYVVLISKEEFTMPENKESMKSILATLADSYLLGDVGTVSKNFTNWGYRSNGDLVILDYAYIYRIIGDEMICKAIHNGKVCQEILQYDDNFYQLFCPKCRKKYSFHTIRNRIDKEFETRELTLVKTRMAYKLTQSVQEVKEYDDYDNIEEDIDDKENIKEDTVMGKDFINTNISEDKDPTEMYMDALEFMFREKEKETEVEEPSVVIDERALEDTLEELTEDEEEYIEVVEDIPVYFDDTEDEKVVEETNIEFDLDTHETRYIGDAVEEYINDEAIGEIEAELTQDSEDEFVEDTEEYDDELHEEEIIGYDIPADDVVLENNDTVEDSETNVTIEVPEDSNVTIKIISTEETEDNTDDVVAFDNIDEEIETSKSNVNEGVIMKFYTENETVNEEDIRNELKASIMEDTEEYDDVYDDEYDDIINDKMARKYNKYRGDF